MNILIAALIFAQPGELEQIVDQVVREAERIDPVEATPAPTVNDALSAVVQDARQIDQISASLALWIWFPSWITDPVAPAATNLATLLAMNHSSQLYRPASIADPVAGLIQRYDLRAFSGHDPGLLAYQIRVIEQLGTEDPFFHLPRSVLPGGADLIPVPGSHIDTELIAELQTMTGRSTSILSADMFVRFAVSSEDGGRYLILQGLKYFAHQNPGKTDRQLFLESLGVDESSIIAMSGDKAAMVFHREPTGKNGIIRQFPTDIGRNAIPGLWLTQDGVFGDIGNDQQPEFDLLSYKPVAEEFIAIGPDGLIRARLGNTEGKFVASADPGVASDTRKPALFREPINQLPGAPFHFGGTADRRLEAIVSCINCHTRWLRELDNGARSLMQLDLNGSRSTIFGDFTESDPFVAQERLRAFVADFGRDIATAREDFERNTGYLIGQHNLESPVATLSAAIVRMHNEYRWTGISPDAACLRLGYRVPAGDGALFLKQRLTAPPGSRENVHLQRLQGGWSIQPDNFGRIYSDLYQRLHASQIERTEP